MKPRFLIGNTFSGNGRIISKLIRRFRIDAKCCGNNMQTIYDEIKKDQYTGIVFYMRGYNEETFDMLQKLLNENPRLRIYAILMINSDSIKEKLRLIGVRNYFETSNPPIQICATIAADIDDSEEKIYTPEIINYLYNKRIPYDLIGFNYLAVGIKKCIDNPSMVKSKMKTTKMYPAIAEACSTSAAAVERGLRKIARIAASKNITFNGMTNLTKLTAGNMVVAAAKEYIFLQNSGKI